MKKNLIGFVLCAALPFSALANSEYDNADEPVNTNIKSEGSIKSITVKMGDHDDQTEIYVVARNGLTYSCQEVYGTPSQRAAAFLEIAKMSLELYLPVSSNKENCNLTISAK
ncbi:hypothetical protein [Aeromonas salmonicida]|uniref:hypothetical protein n=1 Tax=Aeromonas salmonicida TaxID=645 RepID=UPI003D1E11A0